MVPSVTEILRWEADAARELSAASRSRAISATDMADGLARLSSIRSWEGSGADAAQTSSRRLRVDLTAHADEADAISRAAMVAADDIEEAQRSLRRLFVDAADLGMEVDSDTNRVVPRARPDGTTPPTDATIGEMQERLESIRASAQTIDDELAAAIQRAGSERVSPGIQLVDRRTIKDSPIPPPGDPNVSPSSTAEPNAGGIRDAIKGLPQGSSSNFLEVRDPAQLQQLGDWATNGQQPYESPNAYRRGRGEMYRLQDGTIVARGASVKHGATLEFRFPDGTYYKLHINAARGGDVLLPRGFAEPPIARQSGIPEAVIRPGLALGGTGQFEGVPDSGHGMEEPAALFPLPKMHDSERP